jgi:hypothetical protein
VSTEAKEDESSTGRVWAAGFHHVTARSRLARVLELINRFTQSFSSPSHDRSKASSKASSAHSAI